MKKLIFIIFFITSMPLSADSHLIILESSHSTQETADRFANLVEEKGLTLFARIDHAKNAASVDLELGPTEVILFGNPKVGTLLMQCAATISATMGIDLPQKVLVWENAEGATQLAYTDPNYLKDLHSMQGCEDVITKVSKLLAKLASAATSK